MSKPDKLPWIDPNVRGVFNVIVATAAEIRKHRRTEEYRREQERIALSEKTRHDANEFERRKREAEAQDQKRYASALAAGFIRAEHLPMREAEKPKFVR